MGKCGRCEGERFYSQCWGLWMPMSRSFDCRCFDLWFMFGYLLTKAFAITPQILIPSVWRETQPCVVVLIIFPRWFWWGQFGDHTDKLCCQHWRAVERVWIGKWYQWFCYLFNNFFWNTYYVPDSSDGVMNRIYPSSPFGTLNLIKKTVLPQLTI